MVFIDQALRKILNKLPKEGAKTALNHLILPFAKPVVEKGSSKHVLVFSSNILIKCLQQI